MVVLGHTYGIPQIANDILNSFHMPLFFIISGFLYNEEKYNRYCFKQVFAKKFKNYLIPYFSFAFINLILQILWNIVIKKQIVDIHFIFYNIKGILLCQADINHMPNCSPIWFLISIFTASIIFWLIMKYAKKFVAIISLLFLIISYCESIFIHVFNPWNIFASFMAVFFMYLGYTIKSNIHIIKILKFKYFYLLLIPLNLLSILFALKNTGIVSMHSNYYGNIILFILPAVTFSITTIILCENFPFLQNKGVAWLGRNTMPVIGFNYFIRDFTTEAYYIIPYIKNFQLNWIVSFILTMLGCVVTIVIYNKLKYIRQHIFYYIKIKTST